MLIVIAALISTAAGAAVLLANPHRFPNRVFLVLTVLFSTFLLFIHFGVADVVSARDGEMRRFPWHRGNAVISAFFPWITWLLNASIVTAKGDEWKTVLRSVPWLCLGGALTVLSYADSFIFGPPQSGLFGRGPAYLIYNTIHTASHLFIVLNAFFQMRVQIGLRRIEMKFVGLNIAIVFLLGTVSTSTGNFLQIRALKDFAFIICFGGLALALWTMIAHRIFDVWQVTLSLVQRIIFAFTFGLIIFGIWHLYQSSKERRLADLVIIITFFTSIAFWLDRKTRDWIDLDGTRLLAGTRRIIIELARTGLNPEELAVCYKTLLREQCQTPAVTLLFAREESYTSDEFEFGRDRPGFSALCEAGWATPESLERRRSTPAHADLQRFLAAHSLGLMLTAPHGSSRPSLLIALGTKTNQWPFTYPEIVRLQNIAELIDNILTHARLIEQAAQQAKMEHLAMMSRGLAHDLKNLITPISSFLIHTDERFPAGSAEAEVHSSARRSVRIMTDYVREALFFSERLAPKYEPVDLDKIFSEMRGLASSHATRQGVTLTTSVDANVSLMADAVLLQRLIANLVHNAIDASTAGQTVAMSATAARAGWMRLQVVDEGCGIAAENLSRIFEPYFTTKQFGDEVRGFGLGLTICQKIAQLHGGTISVRSDPGHGTTMTIDLPAAPPPTPPVLTQAPLDSRLPRHAMTHP